MDSDENMEEHGFEYSDEEPEEQDVDIENQYNTTKGLVETDLEGALKGFAEVVKMEGEKGEWGFKALKQTVKLHYQIGNQKEMIDAYREMLTYIKSAVTRNYSEKCINNILDFVSNGDNQDLELLQEFYQTTLKALEEAENDRLWFKTNLKLCKLWFDMEEYGRVNKILKELHKSCQKEDGTDDQKKGTQFLEEKNSFRHGSRASADGVLSKEDETAKKYRSMWTRTLSSVWMIGGFVFIVYMGHLYIWAMIVVIQLYMAQELFTLARGKTQREVKLPGFRLLNWHFFITAMLYVYGRFLNKHLVKTIHSDHMIPHLFKYGLIKYHMLICYSLYIAGFVWFILTLKKGLYKYQFGQFAWTHMILFVVFAQSSFTVANIFEGIIWFLLPASLIVINDIMAYFFGIFFGKTPLIKLSPKKTWEGFIGASVTTVMSAFMLAYAMGQSEWLTCPRRDLSTGWLHCDPGPLFKPKYFPIPAWTPQWFPWREYGVMPVQTHAMAFGLFASLVAPFGGFFASGFKRAFKIKDFGDSLPGHGGMTDRMDCQMVMAVFSYIYYQSFIAPHHYSAEYFLDQVLVSLTYEEQLGLYKHLGEALKLITSKVEEKFLLGN